MTVDRQTVDLTLYPDLVVIYLGMAPAPKPVDPLAAPTTPPVA